MKVTAISKGYYGGHIREVGNQFELKDGKTDFSKLWMIKGHASAKEVAKVIDDPAPADDPDPDPDDDDGEDEDVYSIKHSGAGKWDVLDGDGDVIEGGDNLSKKKAQAMADELNEDDED